MAFPLFHAVCEQYAGTRNARPNLITALAVRVGNRKHAAKRGLKKKERKKERKEGNHRDSGES